jgi:hypothetical protein
MLSQLDCHVFGLETIKEQYANDVEFRDVTEHCKEGHHGIDICCRMGFCLELTTYAFQLVPFVYCCCRRHMEAD